MTELGHFIDDAQAALDCTTKVELATRLGITPQELNRARKDGYCSDEVIEKLAEITKTPSVIVFSARELTKPQSPSMKKAWYEIFINLQTSKLRNELFHADTENRGPVRIKVTGNLHQARTRKDDKKQSLTGTKDYRKYLFILVYQRLTTTLKILFPITAIPRKIAAEPSPQP